jgi:hypothetical protein
MANQLANIHDAFFKQVLSDPDLAGTFLREHLPTEVAELLGPEPPEPVPGMPPDGAIHLCTPRSLDARAWLPATVEGAKARIDDWRKKDSILKTARRRRPRIVRGTAARR